jgi:hypothetical protein
MSSGSNVNISLNFDSLNNPSTLTNTTLNILNIGDWLIYTNNVPNKSYLIPYIYSNPGHFTVTANVSNSLSFYTFTQAVVIMTKVDYLIPQLLSKSNLVVLDVTTGKSLAQFVFSYFGTTKAGSDAYVTFWPGDSANNTFGPYPLNMDYNANMSRAALQYTYTSKGSYQVSFFVTNPLGSKWFTLNIQVVEGMSGFYASVSPLNAQVGTNVAISAFLVQGFNVTYNWKCNGVSFATGPKTCKFFSFLLSKNTRSIRIFPPKATLFSVPDSRNYVVSSPGNYTFTVEATDSFSTLTNSYVLEVQRPITALTATVNPSTPQMNIDTGKFLSLYSH